MVAVARVRAVLWLLLLLAATVFVLWQVIQPMLPWILVGFVLLWIFGFILGRRRRW
jgi:hypothetical protein